ncbi:MAG TPA: UDP-3-O-(3-hydroxymyristoyl)glucosamine N-acyltransferase [Polyangiaceae bacterium]|jgi:UDP-3-O-[3-hydroxymyristoyl] glucosamine N-acyltransferase|nr:UDP-3-O-(3-hydroxymyristoyl)glucosamine N-acyltransferase [Polyangiaceae bacterium]
MGVWFSTPPVTLGELAERHGGAVDAGAGTRVVERIAPIERGEARDLCPLTSRRHLRAAFDSPSALLVAADLAPLVAHGRRWVHEHASFALAAVLGDLEGPRERARSDRAFIDPAAQLAADVAVGPFAVIMEDVIIGPGSVVQPHAVIFPRVRIGARVVVGASAVVGRPGFGWATGPAGALARIPQLGGVLVEDDVEIGALCTVDAGTLAPTVLRRGTRLDAHVHVGHNASLGPSALVAAQSGFAGSVDIGAGVRVGGQAGVADHVRVGSGAHIAAKSGVIGDVSPGQVVAGYPAVNRGLWLRGMARLLRRKNKRK